MPTRLLKIPRAYWWPALLILAIFAASSTPRLATPDLGFQFSKDKLAHFLVFGLVATAILRTPWLRRRRCRDLITAVVITSAYGCCDEFRQSLTPGRSVEVADWIADTLGAIVAVSAYARWHLYRRILEWRATAPRTSKRA
ncbi:VanZ family protein [Coraliomargarita algicola]|uniref:VanZ family protein n=1 Tax=Coraliomargarita algicola TaxID=3092156 RepID=A0ABZ0RH99_9BACT|nr:VanZ family protein [Coraliomargarita sp. J2-16]WPJ94478.1 VanZ family protein [Coraliomargarita sp. J2-16]